MYKARQVGTRKYFHYMYLVALVCSYYFNDFVSGERRSPIETEVIEY